MRALLMIAVVTVMSKTAFASTVDTGRTCNQGVFPVRLIARSIVRQRRIAIASDFQDKPCSEGTDANGCCCKTEVNRVYCPPGCFAPSTTVTTGLDCPKAIALERGRE